MEDLTLLHGPPRNKSKRKLGFIHAALRRGEKVLVYCTEDKEAFYADGLTDDELSRLQFSDCFTKPHSYAAKVKP